ncbi:hypothetical protein ACH4CD_22590 [Streptomyces fungicidicus]|uniref:hypothetical protein n=1 Tax=Streptomyces fungicidicus TaxID=68203 RepID=UPI0037908D61
MLLVRSVEDDSFPLEVLAEVAGAVGREEDVVTVIVGSADGGGAPGADHWARLGALLDSLRARGTDRIRLVMSGAGDDRPDRPCVARRIADAWELEVTAPDGAVLITPGGALFVHGDPRPGCGWWRFAPGAEPRKLGRRAPAPDWEEALDGVPVRTSGGCVVERVPAGVLIRPAEAPAPAPDDLCFSVPVDFERLTVLVGAPHAEDVAADEVAAVLAGLPEAERSRARLAPGGRRDLLRLGQSVADRLGTEVEVLTGLPLLDDHAPPGTAARPTLVGRDGRPSWRPFVSSVVCGPVDAEGRAPVPRPVGLHPPDWILGGGERGTVRLTDRWQASVTRAGLALWAPDGPRPGPLGPAVDPEVCAIELGMPGQPLDGSLLPALSRLLRGLGTDVRSRTTLLVRGRLLSGDGALRRLAAEHGIPGIRYVTAGRPAVTAGRPGPAAALPAGPAPAGAAARRPGSGGDPVTVGSGGASPTRGHAGRVATGGADEPGEAVGGAGGVEPGRAGASGVAAPSSVVAAGTSGRGAAPGPGTAAAPAAGPRPSGGGAARRAASGGAGASGGGAARRPGVASDGPHAIEPGRDSSPGALARESGTAAAARSVEPRGGAGGGRGDAESGRTAPSCRAGSDAEAPASAAAPDALRSGGPAGPAPVQPGGPAEEDTEAAGPSAAGPGEKVSPPAEGGDGAAGQPGVPGAAGEATLSEAAPAAASPDVVEEAQPRVASADGSRAGADNERGPAFGPGAPPDVVREGRVGAQARSGVASAAGVRARGDDGATVGAGGERAAGADGSPDAAEEGPVGTEARSDVVSAAGARAGDDSRVTAGTRGQRTAGVGVSPDVVPEGPQEPAAGGAVVRPGTAPAAGVRAGGDGGAAVGAGGERASRAGGSPDAAEEGPVGAVPGGAEARSGVASAAGVRAGVSPEGPQEPAAGGAVARAGTAPAAGVRAAGWGRDGVARGRAALPFVPGHVSGVTERAAFRDAAAGAWEGHAAAVSRVLTRMPALRGHELEAARTDLVAAHAYLTADEGPLHHRELTRDLRAGEGRLLPYAGCLASALRRLPSYRGVALRGGDADGPEPPVGALLQDPAPVSALAGTSAVPAGAGVRYAIWSVTGRKVRQLLDRPGGDPESYEEIVFVPGTGFRVLAVRTVSAGPSVVLLRELPGNATAYMDGSEELSGLDLKALAHLEEALAKGFRAGGATEWPERCSGPVGQDG